jgi:hypothetical protein
MKNCLRVLVLFICTKVTAQPTISSFSPASGPVGTTVIISGNNFAPDTAENIVFFGAVKARVTLATSNSLSVTVPVGALYKRISVTSKGKTAYSSDFFTVLFNGSPLISNFFKRQNNDSTKELLASYLFSADLDGDGRPDLIKSDGSGSSITVVRNISSGKGSVSFTDKKSFTTGINPYFVAIGDLDGDGKLDLAVANQGNNSVSVFRNISTVGNIQFDTSVNYTIGSDNQAYPNVGYPNVIEIADFNNDGRPDIVSAAGNNSLFSVLINQSEPGTISFPEKKDFGSTFSNSNRISGARDIAVGDFNRDGKTDIAFADAIGDAIIVFKNTSENGGFSFSEAQHFGTGGATSTKLAIADLDGDNRLDIVFANLTSKTLSILKNTSTSDSIIFAPSLDMGNLNSHGLVVENFDGSMNPDIISADIDKPVLHLFKNNSTTAANSFTTLADLSNEFIIGPVTSADFDKDGKPDICVGTGLTVFLNTSADIKINSFTPTAASTGDTVTIKGYNFTGTNSVHFGSVPAAFFLVKSDSVLSAVVSEGASGKVSVKTTQSADSLAGFTYIPPVPKIILTDTSLKNLSFVAVKGSYSTVQYFTVAGKDLQSNIIVTAPPNFEVSQTATNGFATSVSLTTINKTVDSSKIYVRFKMDSSAALVNGQITITATNAVGKNIAVSGTICDSVIFEKPVINGIIQDTTLCIKDSLTLTVAGNYNNYKWSTGDSSSTLTIKNTSNISLRVGSKDGCYSNNSSVLKIIKNTNPIPILALTNDSTLLSSGAPRYRWYFNNNIIVADTTNMLRIRKIGFYAVETSNDKICWDRSNDFPIIMLATPLVNDSVSLKTYPNPAPNGNFTIVATLERVTNVVARVTITDANGVVLLQSNKFIFFGKEIKIPIALSVKGTVFIRLEINGDIKTQTVILQ